MESIVIYFIAGIFGLAILGKLTGKTKPTFEKAGLSTNFMYGLALVELAFTIGLFSNYALYSIIGLLMLMLGAIATLFRQNAEPKQYVLSIVAMGLLLTQLVTIITDTNKIT